MNPYHDSWTKSKHAEVNCLNCHLQPGLTGYVKGKINGLAQLVDCVVGRIGTKPNATIVDASCLRSQCHATTELPIRTFGCANVRFAHDNDIDKVVDGIKITCGTCHSHFEGAEHFSVNRDTCFTCHFLGGGTSDNRLVKTDCQSCHEVPKQVIRRGYVKIDHQEFVSYKANCEESCHKRELRQASHVDETVCWIAMPIPRRRTRTASSCAALQWRQVECFACHRRCCMVVPGRVGVRHDGARAVTVIRISQRDLGRSIHCSKRIVCSARCS
jgi:hypothetical protein